MTNDEVLIILLDTLQTRSSVGNLLPLGFFPQRPLPALGRGRGALCPSPAGTRPRLMLLVLNCETGGYIWNRLFDRTSSHNA